MSEQLLQSSMIDILASRAISAETLRDLHAIASLGEEARNRIADALGGLEGLTTSDAIENAVQIALGEEDAGKAESVVNALSSLKPQALSSLTESVPAWVLVSEPRREIFSDTVLQQLARNLKILVSDIHAVELMQKADQLLRDVGKVVSYRPAASVMVAHSSVDHFQPVKMAKPRHTWTDSAESILARLEDPTIDTQERDAVALFAGTTAFSDEQRPRLLAALAAYINQHRFTRDDDRITVVGSAARKYAMNMGEAEFERYAEWLLPEQTEYPTPRAELELVKGICWRVSFEPLKLKGEFPMLARTLVDIASGYTNSRFLLQENFAAIALNAIVSIFVLDAMAGRSELAAKIWKRVGEANRNWFTEMVQRRLADAAVAIHEHDDALSQSVGELAVRICTVEKDS